MNQFNMRGGKQCCHVTREYVSFTHFGGY